LITGGTVKCWGANYLGQLGNGTTTDSRVPVVVSSLTGATAISISSSYSCALITGGTVKCWGYNDYGQLGDGTTTSSSVPVDVWRLTDATAITTGYLSSCALITGGTVKCWGYNDNGQLGDNTTTDSSVPVVVSNLTGATAISTGSHSCALITGGTVKCWGYNDSGQLGDNTTTNSSVPVVVSNLTGATAISAGFSYSCALITGGTVKCWGSNYSGKIGNGLAWSTVPTSVLLDFGAIPAPVADTRTPATPVTPAANSNAPTTLKNNQIRGSQTGTTTHPIPYVITDVPADVTSVVITATLQTSKASTADRLLKKPTIVRGTCIIKTGKKTKKRTARCSIRLKKAGIWLVTFTPRNKTTTGTATSKKITIRTPVKSKTTARLLSTRQL
jgi:hypothetical protein